MFNMDESFNFNAEFFKYTIQNVANKAVHTVYRYIKT